MMKETYLSPIYLLYLPFKRIYFCSTLVAFRSFILCFLDGYNKALCNDELYLVKGGPASGSIILNLPTYLMHSLLTYLPFLRLTTVQRVIKDGYFFIRTNATLFVF